MRKVSQQVGLSQLVQQPTAKKDVPIFIWCFYALVYILLLPYSDCHYVKIRSNAFEAFEREFKIFYIDKKKYLLGSKKKSTKKWLDGKLSM